MFIYRSCTVYKQTKWKQRT